MMKKTAVYDQLKTLVWDRPFKPFRIVLNSGEFVTVKRPNGLVFNPVCGVYDDTQDSSFEFTHDEVERIIPAKSVRRKS